MQVLIFKWFCHYTNAWHWLDNVSVYIKLIMLKYNTENKTDLTYFRKISKKCQYYILAFNICLNYLQCNSSMILKKNPHKMRKDPRWCLCSRNCTTFPSCKVHTFILNDNETNHLWQFGQCYLFLQGISGWTHGLPYVSPLLMP